MKNIKKKNSEALIICVNKLYKLMESFFFNFGIIFRINYNFLE